MQNNQMNLQLKESGQLTEAAWATWLECSIDWELVGSYNINPKQRNLLMKFLLQPGIKAWLNGALTGKHIRPRSVPEEAGRPGLKLYAFPNQLTQRVILVAAKDLSEAARRFWKRVALGDSGSPAFDLASAESPLNVDLIPYYLPSALDSILGIIVKTVECQGGWLAIRSGDYLEIKAHTEGSDYLDRRLLISGNPVLTEILKFRKTCLVKKNDPEWAIVPHLGFVVATKAWNAFPLVIGTRFIGMAAIWGKNPLSPEDVAKLTLVTKKIAISVEGNTTFTDLSNHLQRMAYLNDFAVTVFSSQDLEQIVQRTFALLRRAFNTERIYLLNFSPDGNGIQNYYDNGGLIESKINSKASLPSQVYKGNIYRTNLIHSESAYKPVYPGSRSALVTPLKFRKQVIGVLGLESQKEGVFTINDEHLVAVIACYIAGLLENGRLRNEAEVRARNLSLIHEVVEKVIGQTDVRQVAQVAAELMAQNFNYELVVVALIRGPKKELQLAGIGGERASKVQNGLKSVKSPGEKGIARRVALTGKSALVNDIRKELVYLPIPGWRNGSDMCVALKEGDQSFGIIEVESLRKNAFSRNDLLVLESLGGILASVISNVGQYQKLQMTVKQLRATQDELQEHIAAQRMAETRLVQAAKLAAVGEMAAGIAHELNNPLTTVSGFTELTLEEAPPDSRLHADLELVLREAHRATDVVRRLLDFARQSESVRMHSDINEIVKEVLALVNHLLHTSGVELITNLPGGLPTVSVDRNQVKQVILNLIHNALHAMSKGGELRITTTRRSRDHQDWVVVLISDNGIGISRENLERIFEPFFTTRSKEGGTGLGLSISYGIIAEHGGFIEAESQVGKGSIFSVWIPVEVN